MQYMGGIVGTDVSDTIQSIGWLSIALVIFTLWRPILAIFGSVLFGALQTLRNYVGVPIVYMHLVDILPYLVTIIVLIVISVRKKRENQAPASLGLSYFREDR